MLGRTGLEVSVAGLGCGGHSRLGRSYGRSEAEAIEVVRRALDLGITFFDTASAYGTEEILGKALDAAREQVVVSTKVLPWAEGGGLTDAAGLRRSVEKSLRLLKTDRIDVLHLHGVLPDAYDDCVERLVPELMQLREAGKVRFLAISEAFASDTRHDMLAHAVQDPYWDVVMVGLNLLNPSARYRVLPTATEQGIGVLVMFAVRKALSRPAETREVVMRLIEQGQLDIDAADVCDPLGFLLDDGAAGSVVDAAYRFARHEPGTHVVLTGTGNTTHLAENIMSLERGPLPGPVLARLDELFGAVDSVAGN